MASRQKMNYNDGIALHAAAMQQEPQPPVQQMNYYPKMNALPNYNDAIAMHPAAMQQQLQPTAPMIQPAAALALGSKPTRVTCPSCHQLQISKINYVSNTKTHLIALILFFICGCCCCCCIPYCMASTRVAEHSCSLCGAYLGKHDN